MNDNHTVGYRDKLADDSDNDKLEGDDEEYADDDFDEDEEAQLK